MSNIERKYAYYDEGILPEEGEYGITYLTLYSSNAGNIYDGWIWDPDRKTTESATERTFGYRNPDYPDYCWDDEIVVDLSNAQQRQETTDFEQGRITSFNTNVSDKPIILEDTDITALTEEERERKATVVLFSAIPLVTDSYIHAQIEIQCKVNLSEDNTSGVVRVEAFYILNDESDRTMRPNPVHTFTVCTENERHTLPFMYWNPALKHDDHNYIGVKLLATGGTVEIGISDDPHYGDAIITLIGAGLTGDNIFGGKPAALEIFGLDEVYGGYELDIDDYTVLCTYDTGEIYEVTHMCEFDPEMGTEIVDPITTLTAYYQGLQASMQIRLGIVEEIELIGPEEAYDEYTFDIKDWTVLAYFDNGDVLDVTNQCTYNPVMGTRVTVDTELTATYEPYWQTGSAFTASSTVEIIHDGIITAYGDGGEAGLLYTLYKGNQHEGYYNPNARPNVVITGNADILEDPQTHLTNVQWHEYIHIPLEIQTYMQSNNITEFDITWRAEGDISGIDGSVVFNNENGSLLRSLIGFKDVKIKPYYSVFDREPGAVQCNPIIINFNNCKNVDSNDLKFLNNIEGLDTDVADLPVIISRTKTNSYASAKSMNHMFYQCESLTDLDFLTNFYVSENTDFSQMFEGCTNLSDITGLRSWDMQSAEDLTSMFANCSSLKTSSGIESWNVHKVKSIQSMFAGSALVTLSGIGSWINLGEDISEDSVNVEFVFYNTKIYSLAGLNSNFFNPKVNDLDAMFRACPELKSLDGVYNLDMSNVTSMAGTFSYCPKLVDISNASNWDVSNVKTMAGMFWDGPANIKYVENVINNWNLSSCEMFGNMFIGPYDTISHMNAVVIPSDKQDIEHVFIDGHIVFDYDPFWKSKHPDWPDPIGRYYTILNGMFACVVDVKYHNEGQTVVVDHVHVEHDYINSLPTWYTKILHDYIRENGPFDNN